jgi:hypothetical protein
MTLDDTLQELANTVYQHGKATRTNTPFHYGEPMGQAKEAILSDLLEIIGEDNKVMVKPEPIQGIDQLWLDGRATGEFSAKNQLRQELRDKVKEYCK